MADKALKTKIKTEQKALKKATKQVKSDFKQTQKVADTKKKGGALPAARLFQKASDNLFDLPPVLLPLVLLVCYQMLRNALEKNQREQNYIEAQRFLRQRDGFS